MARSRVHLTGVVDPSTKSKLQDAAYWTEGETVSSLMEKGALDLVARLEKERGEPFPPREGDVRTGRPKKTSSNVTRAPN